MVDEIEAGATGDELRIWLAKEAFRQAELRLGSQAASLQAFETRATAIMGWIALAVSTIAGASIVSLDAHRIGRAGALAVALAPALLAALSASRILWPKQWRVVGYAPDIVLDSCVSELQQIEYFVSGYAVGITENDGFLDRASSCVRLAWWALLATPLIAVIAVALTWAAAAE